MHDLTPKKIVEELDRHIVGQDEAKRAVAVAIRNRWRRRQLDPAMRVEVTPKNIIMIGPTGVGKTEIARRIASLVNAPFCKVEATKYTEVGYHGRDVESVVRDLVEAAHRLVKGKERDRVKGDAAVRANDRLCDLLLPDQQLHDDSPAPAEDETHGSVSAKRQRVREKMRAKLLGGELEEAKVTLRTEKKHVPVQIFSNLGMEQMDVDLQNMFEKIMPKDSRPRELYVRQAREILIEQEIEQLIDRERIAEESVALAESSGIIFIDEIDKICSGNSTHGPDVSRQGVQRDLLPIVEGTAVQTRYGTVHTEHILFIAAGAFHVAKPADLMPELQGRFPIRVQLQSLYRNDFLRILKEPENSLIRQYAELLRTDGLSIRFTDDGLERIADIAHTVNTQTQNIGARRLHTILEKILEEPSFWAPDDLSGELVIDAKYVDSKLDKVTGNEDLSKYIL